MIGKVFSILGIVFLALCMPSAGKKTTETPSRFSKYENVHSILIYKNGKLAEEHYFTGKDRNGQKRLGFVAHDSLMLHDVRSISKSVVSACIGIAIQKKIIGSVNDSLKNYFPEIENENFRNITIRQLLTMTSGIEWKEIGNYGSPFNDEIRLNLSFRPLHFILKRSITGIPGKTWNYSAANTHLLAAIIERKSGMSIDKFAVENLFTPLEIRPFEWRKLYLSKIVAAASGLRLSSRDLGKIGLLYLNHGNWNGHQILDEKWADTSLKNLVERPNLKVPVTEGGYGYQFWTYEIPYGGKLLPVSEAKGNGGQSIFISKENNLVVVITSGNYNCAKLVDQPLQIFKEQVLPDYAD